MGIRIYRPTSAGRRNSSVNDFSELTTDRREKSLCKRIKNPVNYSVIKNRMLAPQGKKRRAQHTSSQHK